MHKSSNSSKYSNRTTHVLKRGADTIWAASKVRQNIDCSFVLCFVMCYLYILHNQMLLIGNVTLEQKNQLHPIATHRNCNRIERLLCLSFE
jgi:hypothetical protein